MVTKSQENFISLIKNFNPQSVDQKKDLENIIFEFPYFQLAHAIYLKSIKKQDQFNFDLILKKTAILSLKRKLIFNWVENTENNLFRILERSTKKEVKESTTREIQTDEITIEEKTKEKKQRMFFVDWVSLYSGSEKQTVNSPLESKIEIIDSFLEKNIRIPNKAEKSDKGDFSNLASANKFNKSELMTETLAKIYVKQKKIKKALYAYKILSLKYPEKSSLFANQIKKLQKKQNKKI